MSKYEPLTEFLKQSGQASIRLSFSQIEEILGFPLPASKQYAAWWSNSATNNTMTKAWLKAGYKAGQVDVAHHAITFRTDAPPEPPGASPRSALFGSMKGTTFLSPDVDLAAPMEAAWTVALDSTENVIVAHEAQKLAAQPNLNTSQKIRALARLGLPRAEIARLLGKRYQHVRNVLVAEQAKAD